jgi:hypothetical protein
MRTDAWWFGGTQIVVVAIQLAIGLFRCGAALRDLLI